MSEGSSKDQRRIFLPKTALLPKMSARYGGSANKKANQNLFHPIQNLVPALEKECIFYWIRILPPRIAADLKLPSQFAALVSKIREFLENHAFGEKVDLDDPAMIKAIS